MIFKKIYDHLEFFGKFRGLSFAEFWGLRHKPCYLFFHDMQFYCLCPPILSVKKDDFICNCFVTKYLDEHQQSKFLDIWFRQEIQISIGMVARLWKRGMFSGYPVFKVFRLVAGGRDGLNQNSAITSPTTTPNFEC